jgi:hypothetical protein
LPWSRAGHDAKRGQAGAGHAKPAYFSEGWRKDYTVQFWLSRRSALLLFLITFAVYALLVLFFSRPPGMSMTNGDEPHYLLQMHSLLVDHDLEVQNNYANLDYRDFFVGETLNVGAYLYQYHGRTIRHHFSLGMPLLLTPAYALGGRVGVQLLLALLTAGGMSCLLLVARRFMPPSLAFASVLLCDDRDGAGCVGAGADACRWRGAGAPASSAGRHRRRGYASLSEQVYLAFRVALCFLSVAHTN